MPIPKTQLRLPKVLARDQVYQQLRLWLVEGVLMPGEKLNYHEIGKRLGFSVIPIREACMRLHYEGFIEMAHSRWTRVVDVDVKNTVEVCETVEALEIYAFESATPSLRSGDIRRLKSFNHALQQALEDEDRGDASLTDRSFHSVWVERLENQRIKELLEDCRDRIEIAERELFGSGIHSSNMVGEHEAIIDALEQKDFEEATLLLRKHWLVRIDRLRAISQKELNDK